MKSRDDVFVVDFFAGCGGTSLGFRNAGLTILAGLDNDRNAASTFRRNFPEAVFFEQDIRAVPTDEIRAAVPEGARLLLSGCAPCQPFSKQNRQKRTTDGRRSLLGEFERFVLALRPEFVVVENVPGLQKVGNTGPLQIFIHQLRRAGYDVRSDVLKALDYGVPQLRQRLVLVARLGGIALLPEPPDGAVSVAPPTVREWISGLPPLQAGESCAEDPDHTAMRLSDTNLLRILATREGGGREDWPPELVLDCHRGHRGHSDVYGRLAWERPASAMTTRCLSYSNGRFGHPDQDRAISLREAACLQTFPRDFRFSGNITSGGRQVGNAVPPLLAQRVAEALVN